MPSLLFWLFATSFVFSLVSIGTFCYLKTTDWGFLSLNEIALSLLLLVSLLICSALFIAASIIWLLTLKQYNVTTIQIILITVLSVVAVALVMFAYSLWAKNQSLVSSSGFPLFMQEAAIVPDDFKGYGVELEKAVKKIANRKLLSDSEIESIKPQINSRFGQGRTLLTYALSKGNSEVAAQLLYAGADVYLTDRTDSYRTFFTYITDSSRFIGPPKAFADVPRNHANNEAYEQAQQEVVTDLVRAYVGSGRPVDAFMADGSRKELLDSGEYHEQEIEAPFAAKLATYSIWEPLMVLIDNGANPWLTDTWNPPQPEASRFYLGGSVMESLAFGNFTETKPIIDQLIQKGYFDNRSPSELKAFFRHFEGTITAEDALYKVLKTDILKRNPEFVLE